MEDALINMYRLLDFLPIPIAIDELISVDAEGVTFARPKFHNRSFLDVIGYTVDEVPDQATWLQTVYPDLEVQRAARAQWITSEQLARSKGSNIATYTSRLLCKDGKYRWFEIHQDLESVIYPGFKLYVFVDITPMKVAFAEVERLARTDELTGLPNRRAMLEHLDYEHARVVRDDPPFACILCDIDHFKRLNDMYGHECGDAVLLKMGQLIQHTLRSSDRVARWGGEEFCIVLPKTNLAEAEILVNRLRTQVATSEWMWNTIPLTVTITCGVARHDASHSLVETLRVADQALYRGKAQGRNCVVLATP